MSKILNIILLLIFIHENSFQYIVLKFRTNIDLNKLTDENYMSTTFDQKLYVNFNIGDSHQDIPITIKSQQLPTFVVSSSCSENISYKYNETKSENSFHKIKDYLIQELYRYDFNEGYMVNDTLTFNSSLIFNNFTFMLATKMSVTAKNISGEIGLSIKKQDTYPYLFPDRTQFLEQLKDNNLIKNRIFGIVYDTEYEGKLIFGNYIHKIDNSYDENDMITNTIDDLKDENRDKWHIDFNCKLLKGIDKEEIYTENNTYGLIMYEIGLIVGSNTFREKFIKNYFEEKGCNETMVTSKPFGFYQYSCDKKEQYEDFPDIIFSVPGKYIFNFTKKELFKKIGKKYVFQIVFEIIELPINYWRLGQSFFRKYTTFINWGEKESTFSYFPPNSRSKNKDKKFSSQVILIIILSIILIILIGVIIYFYMFCEKKRRKNRANELIDTNADGDFDYTPADNNIQETNNDSLVNNN